MVEVWKQDYTPLLTQADFRRRDSFSQAFNGLQNPDSASYFIGTGKPEKANAQLDLIEQYLGLKLLLNEGAFLLNPGKKEMKSPEALRVARSKAEDVLLYQRSIQGEQQGEIIAAGADVNAFRMMNGVEVQSHKLARLPSEVVRVNAEHIRKQLIEEYTNPPEGVVRIRWDLGMHVINGTNHAFGDEIEILSKPIDKELLEAALDEAMASGLFLSSNLQFAAIECLRENGKIFSVAFLPQELKMQGKTLQNMRQTPTEELLNRAQRSIVANIPVRYQ